MWPEVTSPPSTGNSAAGGLGQLGPGPRLGLEHRVPHRRPVERREEGLCLPLEALCDGGVVGLPAALGHHLAAVRGGPGQPHGQQAGAEALLDGLPHAESSASDSAATASASRTPEERVCAATMIF
jgi:hypothetical protein